MRDILTSRIFTFVTIPLLLWITFAELVLTNLLPPILVVAVILGPPVIVFIVTYLLPIRAFDWLMGNWR